MLKKMPNNRRITVAAFLVVVFITGYALSTATYSGLLFDLIQYYSFSLIEVSYFDMINEIGQILAMVVGLFLLDLPGKNRTLTLTAVFFGGMMVLTSFVPAILLLVMCRLFMRVSGFIVDSLIATYIVDLYGEKRARYALLLHTFFAIGSMIGPQVVTYMIGRNYGFRETYQMVGFVLLGAAILSFLTTVIVKKPVLAVASSRNEKGYKKIPTVLILKNQNIQWLCVRTALVGGVCYIDMRMPTYLQTVYGSRFSPGFCSLIIALTYLGTLLSSIISGVVSSKISANIYMKFSCISSAIVIVVMILIPGHGSMIAGMFLLGLFNGAQHTVQYIMVFEELPDYSATVASISTIFSSLGIMVIRLIIDGIVDLGYYRETMVIPAAALICRFFVLGLGYQEISS